MRRLEVALIEYRESLEERGIKSPEETERKVATHRRRLQGEYGLLGSDADASGRSKFETTNHIASITTLLCYIYIYICCFTVFIGVDS